MATAKTKQGDFSYILIYFLGWLTGILFFLISGTDKRKKQHAIQAILLGVIGTILFYVPIIGGILGLLTWLYGLYIGYMASTNADVAIPGVTDFAKQSRMMRTAHFCLFLFLCASALAIRNLISVRSGIIM